MGTSMAIGRGAALLGGGLAAASGIGLLVVAVNTIISLVRKNNNTQETIAKRSIGQAQNFPVISSMKLESAR